MNEISQSAASQAVSQLERQLGTRLIDRSKRPFVLTAAGEICYDSLRDILQNYQALQASIRSLHEEIAGLVRVAAIYSVGLHHMGQCLQDFMRQYPKTKVKLEYMLPAKVQQTVLDQEVDIGIVSYPSATRELTVIPLRVEAMVVVCHPDHHLAGRKSVFIRQLQGENIVAFDRDLPIRKEIESHLRESQVAGRTVMEFDNIETIKQAVEIGAGISILPAPTVAKEVQSGLLAAIALSDVMLVRPIGIIHRKRMTFTPAIARFIELLQADARDSEGQR